MPILSDNSLVRRVRSGEKEAYGHLVLKYQGSIFNICYRMLGNGKDAEDVAQDTFIRAYERLDTFDITRPFSPWIRRIASNLCINFMKRNRYPSIEFEEERLDGVNPGGINPDNEVEIIEQKALIRRAILDLSPHYRVAIELRHFQGLTYKEMANFLGLPVNTVKSHLFRARYKLAKTLRKTNLSQ